MYRLDQADRADGHQVVRIAAAGVVLLGDVGNQAQVVFDQFVPGSAVARQHGLHEPSLLLGAQRLRKGVLGREVQHQRPGALRQVEQDLLNEHRAFLLLGSLPYILFFK